MRLIDILNKDYEKIGLDTIVYENKTIDEVIYIDSDGREFTLRDIFEDGNDIINGDMESTLGWSSTVPIDGVLTLSGISSIVNARNTTTKPSIIDENFYVAVTVKSNTLIGLNRIIFNGLSGSGYVASGTQVDNIPVGNYSLIQIADRTLSAHIFDLWIDAGTTGGSIILDDLFVINQSMFKSEPLQAQMDIWRDMYLARKGITKETYTLREFMELNIITNADFKDGINGWTLSASFLSVINEKLNVRSTAYNNDSFAIQLTTKNVNLLHNYYTNLEFYVLDNLLTKAVIMYDGSTAGTNKIVYENTEISIGDILNVSIFDKLPTNATGTFKILIDGFNGSLVEYSNYQIDNVYVFDIEESFDEYMTKEVMDYIVALYKKIKYNLENSSLAYAKGSGISKLDIAYTNKSIDEVVYEGLTLRDIFEHGNLFDNPYFDLNSDGWVINNPFTWADGKIHYDDSATGYMEQDLVINLLENYYWGFNIFDTTGASISLLNDIGTLALVDWVIYNNGFNSLIFNADYALSAVRIYGRTAGDLFKIDNTFLINMSIFIIEPTKAQMDIWKDQFMLRKDLNKQELSYSDIFEKNNYNALELPYLLEQGASLKIDNTITDNDLTKLFISLESNRIDATQTSFFLRHFLDTILTTTLLDESQFLQSYIIIKDIGSVLNIYSADFSEVVYLNDYYAIDLEIFDEQITQAKLETMLAIFKTIKNLILEPEVFLITEPIGFGTRYKMLSVDDKVYGHELDFVNMQFKVNFGINYNAYDGYNLLMEFLADNEAIIEYDWGKGSRFADVRLLEAPKTEKETNSLIISRFSWKLLNPFYYIRSIIGGEFFENTHSQAVTPVVEFTTSSNIVNIELEKEVGGIEQVIKFDFTGESFPLTVIIDSEKKTIKFDDGSNAYDFVDKSFNTFFSIEEGTSYQILYTNTSNEKFEFKQWVVD